jgi:hypothetical protein
MTRRDSRRESVWHSSPTRRAQRPVTRRHHLGVRQVAFLACWNAVTESYRVTVVDAAAPAVSVGT